MISEKYQIFFVDLYSALWGKKSSKKHASFENAYTHKGSCGFSGLKSEKTWSKPSIQYNSNYASTYILVVHSYLVRYMYHGS